MDKVTELIPGLYNATVDFLREKLPEIRKIEGIRAFERIKVIRAQAFGNIVLVVYEVICPDVFPGIPESLIDDDSIKDDNILDTFPTELGDISREVMVTLGYYGNRLQICLVCKKEATKE